MEDCCDKCERAGYSGEGAEIRCGNKDCNCHVPKGFIAGTSFPKEDTGDYGD